MHTHTHTRQMTLYTFCSFAHCCVHCFTNAIITIYINTWPPQRILCTVCVSSRHICRVDVDLWYGNTIWCALSYLVLQHISHVPLYYGILGVCLCEFAKDKTQNTCGCNMRAIADFSRRHETKHSYSYEQQQNNNGKQRNPTTAAHALLSFMRCNCFDVKTFSHTHRMIAQVLVSNYRAFWPQFCSMNRSRAFRLSY